MISDELVELLSPPPCRARVGVEAWMIQKADPHPSLPPKKGKGQNGFV
jgi:hypothetical protein